MKLEKCEQFLDVFDYQQIQIGLNEFCFWIFECFFRRCLMFDVLLFNNTSTFFFFGYFDYGIYHNNVHLWNVFDGHLLCHINSYTHTGFDQKLKKSQFHRMDTKSFFILSANPEAHILIKSIWFLCLSQMVTSNISATHKPIRKSEPFLVNGIFWNFWLAHTTHNKNRSIVFN